jgi:hypothetical protein
MTLATTLFAVAALGGITMAIMRFSGRSLPPMSLALVHGLVAAAGLISLILAVIGTVMSGYATVALGGFVLAALGGFALFSFHLRKEALPLPLIAVHALVAVISFALLLAAILTVRG